MNHQAGSSLTTKNTLELNRGWGYRDFLQGGIKNLHAFYFKVEIEVLIPGENIFPNNSIVFDLSDLAPAGSPTDVVLKVGDSALEAHKAVLTARSPVFKVMFETKMTEGRSGCVELKEISAASAAALLDFFYGREFSLWRAVEPAAELLNAAVMYDVPELRAKCEEALMASITVETVGRILEISCVYDARELKSAALEFLNRNKAMVSATAQWTTVLDRNSKLILNALLEI